MSELNLVKLNLESNTGNRNYQTKQDTYSVKCVKMQVLRYSVEWDDINVTTSDRSLDFEALCFISCKHFRS